MNNYIELFINGGGKNDSRIIRLSTPVNSLKITYRTRHRGRFRPFHPKRTEMAVMACFCDMKKRSMVSAAWMDAERRNQHMGGVAR